MSPRPTYSIRFKSQMQLTVPYFMNVDITIFIKKCNTCNRGEQLLKIWCKQHDQAILHKWWKRECSPQSKLNVFFRPISGNCETQRWLSNILCYWQQSRIAGSTDVIMCVSRLAITIVVRTFFIHHHARERFVNRSTCRMLLKLG